MVHMNLFLGLESRCSCRGQTCGHGGGSWGRGGWDELGD